MSIPQPSVLTALLKTSVKINGVFVQGRQAPNVLQRYCRPVCFFNEGSDYELSSAGSCFLFKHRSHCVALFAKHQLGKAEGAREAREFCIVVGDNDGQKIALTPDAVASPRFNLEEYRFAEDIQFVEYESARAGHDLASLFLDLDLHSLPGLGSVPNAQLVVLFAIGYPTDFISYDVKFDDDFAAQDVTVTHRYSKLLLSSDWGETSGIDWHLTFHQHEKYLETIENLDGFSGSPVFFFFKDADQQVQLGFAGMVRLGSNGIVHAYDSAQIKRLLDHLFPAAPLSY